MEKTIRDEKLFKDILVIIQCPWLMDHAIETKIRTSPIRLLKAVIIPAANDLGF